MKFLKILLLLIVIAGASILAAQILTPVPQVQNPAPAAVAPTAAQPAATTPADASAATIPAPPPPSPAEPAPPDPAAATAAPVDSAAFKAALLKVDEIGTAYQVHGSVAKAFKFYDARPLMVREFSVATAERSRIFTTGIRDGERFAIIFDIRPGKLSRIFLADDTGHLKLVMESPDGGTVSTRTPFPDDGKNFAAQVEHWLPEIAKKTTPGPSAAK